MQLKKLIEQRSRSKSHKEKSDLTLDIGLHYTESGDHENALREYKKLLELSMEKDDKSQWAAAHRLIADCCIELGDFAQAIKHTNEYLTLSIETNNKLEQQRAYVTLGRCFLNRSEQLKDGEDVMRNLRSASQALLNSIKLITALASSVNANDLGEMRAVSLLNLGQVFRAQREFQSANDRFYQCISLARKYRLQKLLLRACYQFCDLALNMIQLPENELFDRPSLLTQLDKSLLRRALDVVSMTLRSSLAKSCSDVESKELLKSVKESYANVYLALGQFRKAAKVCRLLKLNYPVSSDICRNLIRKSMRLANEFQQLPDGTPSSAIEHIAVAKTHERLGDLYAAIELHGSALLHYRLMLLHGEHAHRLNTISSPSDIKLIDAALVSVAETHRAIGNYAQCVRTYRREIQWVISTGSPTAELASSWFSLAQAQRLCFPGETVEAVLPGSETTVDTLNSALQAARQANSRCLMVEILSELQDYHACHNQSALASSVSKQLADITSGPDQASDLESHSSQEDDNDDEALTQFIQALSSDSEIDTCVGQHELLDEFQRGARKSKALCLKTNNKGETPLHVAAINGDMEHAVKLIEVLGHPVNVTDGAGWLPIHEAAFHDRADVAVYLLDRGARLDDLGCPVDESTPLFEAIHNGSLNTALILVQRGANLWHRNKRGECLPELLDAWQPSRRGSLTFGEQRSLFEQLMSAIRTRLQDDYERWCNQTRSQSSQFRRGSPQYSPSSSNSPIKRSPKPQRRHRRSPSPSLIETVLESNRDAQRPKSLRGKRWDVLLNDLDTPNASGSRPPKRTEVVESYKAAMRAVSGSSSRSCKKPQEPPRKKRASMPLINLDDQEWLIDDECGSRRVSSSSAMRSHFESATVRQSKKPNPSPAPSARSVATLRDITNVGLSESMDFAPEMEGFTSTQLPKSDRLPDVVSSTVTCVVSTASRATTSSCRPSSTQPVQSSLSSARCSLSIKVAFADISVLVPVDDSSRSFAWVADEAYRRRQILSSSRTDSLTNAANRVRLSTRDGALLLPTDRLHSVFTGHRDSVVELLAELIDVPQLENQHPSTSVSVTPVVLRSSNPVPDTPSDRVHYITSSRFFKELLDRQRCSRVLNLAFLALGDEDCSTVLTQLRAHGVLNVTELNLQGNNLTLDSFHLWFDLFSHVSNQLTVLNIDSNALTPQSLDLLFGAHTTPSRPQPIYFPRLQRLVLSNNALIGSRPNECAPSSGDTSWNLPSLLRRLISNLPKLLSVDVSGCFLGWSVAAPVASDAPETTTHVVSTLTELNLAWNSHVHCDQLSNLLSAKLFAGLQTVSLRGCSSNPDHCHTTLPIASTRVAELVWGSVDAKKLLARGTEDTPSRGDQIVQMLSSLLSKGHFHLRTLDLGYCQLTRHCVSALKVLLGTSGTSLTTVHLDHNPGLIPHEDVSVWCDILRGTATTSSALVSLSIDFPCVRCDDSLSLALAGVEGKLLPGLCPTPLQKLVLFGAPTDWNPTSLQTNAKPSVSNAHRFCSALCDLFASRFGHLSQCKHANNCLMFGIL